MFDSILKNLDELSIEDLEEIYYSISEFKEEPVSINEFIDSPKFLGTYFTNGFNPFWRKVLNEVYSNPFKSEYWLVSLRGAIGLGKCLAKNTEILMYDGSTKLVQDVIVGDKLMGDDSTPRTVLSLARGKEEMFEIKPTKGNGYVVNKSHILSLKLSGNRDRGILKNRKSGDIIDISVEDFLRLSKTQQKFSLKTYKVGIEFKRKELKIDPYILGIWIGDGSSDGPCITTADKEIVEVIKREAKCRNLKVSVSYQKNNLSSVYRITTGNIGGFENSLLTDLRFYNLINNKHIPNVYKINDRENRLKLLAGLLDSDGELIDKVFIITQKNFQLIKDTQFLARSLGFGVSEIKSRMSKCNGKVCGPYYKISIYGNTNEIPTKIKRKIAGKRLQKKNHLVSGFKVIPKGIDDYYGFEIDGNRRFLLSDFNVTHNTQTAAIGICYDLYRLLCMISPQKSYGLVETTKIVFAIFNVTLSLSTDVVWDRLSQMFIASPFFSKFFGDLQTKRRKGETIFPNRIDFSMGSRIGHSLGSAVFSAIMDEANFEIVGGQVYETFNSLIRRMESRFMTPGGGIPGKLWVVSSETDKFSVLNNIVEAYKNKKGVYIVKEPIWNVIKEKNGLPLYSGKKFWVYVGSDSRPAEILKDDDPILELEPENCIEVPIEHFDSFEADVNAALRDLAGHATTSTYKLFRSKEKLNKALCISKLFRDIIRIDFDDEQDQISNYLLMPNYFQNPLHPNIPRYVHIDIGLTGDRLGISAAYTSSFNDRTTKDISTHQEVVENIPTIATEWAVAIEPTPGKQIPLYKVRIFLQWLAKQRYVIDKVTCDGFASEEMLQLLEKMGFNAELFSVDRTTTPYLTFRSQVYEGRCLLPMNDLLKKECEELEVSIDGKKIDHPAKNKDNTKGSKDLSDSVCGSCYAAEANAHKTRLLHKAAQENELSRYTDNLKGVFWDVND